jgi:nitroreductase family protein
VSPADTVRLYHDQTSHGGGHDRSRLIPFRPLDPTNQPASFKRYPGLPTEALPADLADPLGRLLFLTAGVSRVSSHSYFRTAMSAGNLHPVEVYVVGEDLSVRHYAPLEHGLTALRPGGGRPVALVLTGIPWRTGWKYGERGWRHLYWDAGTMAANLLAVAPDARVELDFDDDALSRLLGLDGTTEFPLAVVLLGRAALPPVPNDLPPLTVDVAPISPRPIDFPLVTEVQRATAERLADLPAYRAERSANLGDEPIESLILRRGSTRMFRRETVPEAAFAGPMDVANASGPLLEHLVAIHAVEGVAPTASRETTEHLTLDQPLGGDAAYTAFHSVDLDRVLEDLGPRAYRAANFEAGLAAGRLQLAAFSTGLGATGLTFYDDEVRQVFATSASCLLVTAVGVPAYRSTAGGPPGRPSRLQGFDLLMTRLQRQLYERRRR